ncbi:GNAT family N-acetyltransferase [Kitasatospora sp. NPDC058218]|uniref:GNAT family N-acetyltransferase n=1 Tax=Kitasatospora sp. NPDC058218 TaxID=3346385 RepID=UPI0036DEACCD
MNTTPAWTVRAAETADVEPVAELRAVVLRPDLERLGRYDEDRVRRRLRDAFSTRWTSIVLVDGVFAGSVTVRPAEQGGRLLEHFYLAPQHQGRGLGSAVLRRALAEADAAGDPVRLDVLQGSPARRLYERHGFVLEAEDPIDVHLFRPPVTSPAAVRLQDRALLRSIGELRAREVVEAACEALVAGLDTPALRMLAACTYGEAEACVADLLPPALAELGLVFHPLDSRSGEAAGLVALAGRLLTGELTPRELADAVHRRYGHESEAAETLAQLDDDYGVLEYIHRTEGEVDAEVWAEARRLTAHTAHTAPVALVVP